MFLVGLGAVRSLAAQPAAAEAVQALQSRLADPFRGAVAVAPPDSRFVASDSRRLK